MGRQSLLLCLSLALLASAQLARADGVVDSVGGAVDTAVNTTKNAAVDAWQWTTGAADSVGSWFSGLGCSISNSWDDFTLKPCDGATAAVPCPAGCAAQLNKLSGKCLKKVVDGQPNATAAIEEVLACGLQYSGASAFVGLLAPLLALLATLLALGF